MTRRMVLWLWALRAGTFMTGTGRQTRGGWPHLRHCHSGGMITRRLIALLTRHMIQARRS
jgi:hypothetical protein